MAAPSSNAILQSTPTNFSTPKAAQTPSRLLMRASTLHRKFDFSNSDQISKRKATVFPLIKTPTARDLGHPSFPVPIVSTKLQDYIEAYAGATFVGHRSTNEDRVVILNKKCKTTSKLISYFAIYDGFSGVMACNHLRDNLHTYIIHNPIIHSNPVKAILEGFSKAEENILKIGMESDDNSGSCALVVLIIDKFVYVANVGSSRCILSKLKGFETNIITNEHNLNNTEDMERVLNLGSRIKYVRKEARIVPGLITVTRCIGCLKVKRENSSIIAIPEVRSTKIRKDMDCLLLLSDGIWGIMSKHEAGNIIWTAMNSKIGNTKEKISEVISNLIQTAREKKSDDNMSAVLIAFNRFISN